MQAGSPAEQRRVFELVASAPFGADIRLYVAECIWPGIPTALRDFEGFFELLLSRTQDIIWSCGAQDLIDNVFAETTYRELKVVLAILRSSASLKKMDLITIVNQLLPLKDRNQCTHVVEFAAGIWTTLPIDISSREVHLRDDDVIAWTNDSSLESLIEEIIPKSSYYGSSVQPVENIFFDQDLTAARLKKICRVGIEWTDNLASHLDYDAKNDKIFIYPHQPLLVGHLQNLDKSPPLGFPISRDVLQETIRTLDLLLPQTAKTRRFLNRNNLKYPCVLSTVKGRDAFDLTNFVYWRSRLARIQALFNRPPTKLAAMWYDRRKPLQWMTFWLAGFIAAATILFGLLSTYTAFKQIEIAQEAYDLTLIQACMSSAVPQSFCESKLKQ